MLSAPKTNGPQQLLRAALRTTINTLRKKLR